MPCYNLFKRVLFEFAAFNILSFCYFIIDISHTIVGNLSGPKGNDFEQSDVIDTRNVWFCSTSVHFNRSKPEWKRFRKIKAPTVFVQLVRKYKKKTIPIK
jgi:hypothetical protein